MSSGAGLVLLRVGAVAHRLALTEALAGCVRERRDSARAVHTLPVMLRLRTFAITCGGARPRASKAGARIKSGHNGGVQEP